MRVDDTRGRSMVNGPTSGPPTRKPPRRPPCRPPPRRRGQWGNSGGAHLRSRYLRNELTAILPTLGSPAGCTGKRAKPKAQEAWDSLRHQQTAWPDGFAEWATQSLPEDGSPREPLCAARRLSVFEHRNKPKDPVVVCFGSHLDRICKFRALVFGLTVDHRDDSPGTTTGRREISPLCGSPWLCIPTGYDEGGI